MIGFFQRSLRTKKDNTYVSLQTNDNYSAFSLDDEQENTFNGNTLTWKSFYPSSICPLSRKDNFYIDSPAHNGVFIGYGIHNSKQLQNDVWFFNKSTQLWRKIQLSGDEISPRTGTRATIVGEYLICFGGFAKGKYLSDLHIINVQTGLVHKIQASGDVPLARTAAIIESYCNKVYVWGGYNKQKSNELSVLDLATMTWKAYPQTVHSRMSIPHIVDGSKIIAYGGSYNNNMLVIDMEANTVYTEECNGENPCPQTINSSFVRAGNEAYYLGGRAGKNTDDEMKLYKYNIAQKSWTEYNTTCNKESAIQNGFQIKNGQYPMKQHNSPTLFFDEMRNKLCFTLGSPEQDTPCVYTLDASRI